jgi:anti-sigma factor RsiW
MANKDKGAAELAGDLTDQVAKLVRREIRIAASELGQKGRQAGLGAALLTFAGMLALYAGGVLVSGLQLMLSKVLPPWLASIVTAALLSATAGAAGALGLQQVRESLPLIPEQAMANAEEDIETARHQPDA